MGDVGGWEFKQLKLPLLTTAACHLARGRAGRPATHNKFPCLFEIRILKERDGKVLLEKVTVCEKWGNGKITQLDRECSSSERPKCSAITVEQHPGRVDLDVHQTSIQVLLGVHGT